MKTHLKRRPRTPKKIPVTFSFLNDLVFAIVPLFGLCAVTFSSMGEDGWAEANIVWVVLSFGALVLFVAYVFCWVRARLGEMAIEFGEDEVWLPPTNLRIKGIKLRYDDIKAVTLSSLARSVRISWRYGWITYGRDQLTKNRPAEVKAILDSQIERRQG